MASNNPDIYYNISNPKHPEDCICTQCRGICKTCHQKLTVTHCWGCPYDIMICNSCELCWKCVRDHQCYACQKDFIYDNEPFICGWCLRNEKCKHITRYCRKCKSLYLMNMGKKKRYICLTCYKRFRKGNMNNFHTVFEKKIGQYLDDLIYNDIKQIIQQYIVA